MQLFFEYFSVNAIFQNTVGNVGYIGGDGASNATKTYAINYANGGTTNIRNNILVNRRLNTLANTNIALNFNGTTTADYNLYYVDATSGALARNNSTTYYATLASLQAIGAGRDANSRNSNPQFLGPTGNAATVDLHISTVTATEVESGGVTIEGFSDDIDANTRNVTTPDIGADEGTFVRADLTLPTITTATIPDQTTITAPTQNFTIADNVGVNTTAGSTPRLYYKKCGDASAINTNDNTTAGWKYVESATGSSPFSFTIDYSLLQGSVSSGSIINYFVVAQDAANNVAIGNSLTFASTPANVNLATANLPNGTLPTYIHTITGGTVTVGTSGIFPNITGACGCFRAVNASAATLTSNTTISVASDLTEDNTYQLNTSGSSNYTTTIQPSAASMRTISGTLGGSSPAFTTAATMIGVNNTGKLIVDGRFAGSGTHLTLRNTNTTPANTWAVIKDLGSNLADNVSLTVQYAIVESNSSDNSLGSVYVFNSGAGVHSLTVDHCIFRDARGGTTGTTACGVSVNSSTGTISITNNEFVTIFNKAIQLTNSTSSTITDNNIYAESTIAPSLFYGIQIGSTGGGTSHTINNNNIGGSAISAGGTAMTLSSAVDFRGIWFGSAPTNAVAMQGNVIQNINLTSTGFSSFYGIYAQNGGINTGTGNTIGHASDALKGVTNAGTSTTFGITTNGSVASTISNNTISNLISTGTGSSIAVYGIGHTGTTTATISSNTISNLSTTSINTSATTPALMGIYLSTATTGQSVTQNVISNLSITPSTLSTVTHLVGIFNSGATGSSNALSRNRIYALSNTSTAVTSSINGIRFTAGTFTVTNNQISIAPTSGSGLVKGISYATATGTSNIFYYNSIYIGGTGAGANSYAFFKEASATATTLRNNLLYNERAGSGSHYAIGVSNLTGFALTSSNYNLLVAPSAATIGTWVSVDKTFSTWQAAQTTGSGGDVQSWSEVSANVASANLFTAPSTGNLNINTANAEAWYVNGKGVQVLGQADDYGATSVRSTTVAAGGTDIGADEMTPSSTPPSATASPASPAAGTQTFTFGGRTIASVVWNSGDLPTAIEAKYYSGVNPPNPSNNSPLTLNAYWSITATGGTVYDYGATLNYDDALLGTVSAEGTMRFSKTNAVLTSWTSYTAVVNTAANTLALASGLSSFSNFSGSGSIALPIEFQSISAVAKGTMNVINFSTSTEKDVKEFAIERSVNNRTWEVMGSLAAIGGTSTANYSFNDVNPTALSYYRVRSVETNGKDQISKIVAVKRNGGKLAVNRVSPVPTTEGVNVDFSTSKIGTLNVVITDIVGKVVRTERFTTVEGANLMRLNLSNLAQGTYILSLNDGETIATQRIVKQ